MDTARGHLIFAFSEDSAQRPFSPSCFISSATRYDIARSPPHQLLSLLAHPWPLANAPCRHTHRGTSYRGGTTLIALGSSPGKVTLQSDADSKVSVNGSFSCITSHGPRQTLPGYCIPEGLHCHQQSFSSTHSQPTGTLCAPFFYPHLHPFSKSAAPLCIKDTAAISGTLTRCCFET